MTKPNNGGPAFPPVHDPAKHDSGMSLRDYFAGQALEWAGSNEWFNPYPAHVAERAYNMADAMLRAREE